MIQIRTGWLMLSILNFFSGINYSLKSGEFGSLSKIHVWSNQTTIHCVSLHFDLPKYSYPYSNLLELRCKRDLFYNHKERYIFIHSEKIWRYYNSDELLEGKWKNYRWKESIQSNMFNRTSWKSIQNYEISNCYHPEIYNIVFSWKTPE